MTDKTDAALGAYFEHERLISIDTLAKFLDVSPNAVRCMKCKGQLPKTAPGLGRAVRWRFGDILEHFGQERGA